MERDGPAFPSRESLERELIAVIRELVQELHPQRSKIMAVSASSRLERDLGIDSLGRTELILRIERTFGVRLPAPTGMGDAPAANPPATDRPHDASDARSQGGSAGSQNEGCAP